MLLKKGKEKFIKPIVLVGMIVLVLCLATCIFHVYDIQKNLEDEINDQMNAHLEVSSQVISDKMIHSIELLGRASEELERDQTKPLTHIDIYSVLQKYQYVDDFIQIVYFDLDGNIYFKDGTLLAAQEDTLEQLKTVEDDDVRMINYEVRKHMNERLLLYAAPVYLQNEKTGMIVGIKSCEGILSSTSFSYLNEIGDTCMVDEAGNIIDSNMDEFNPQDDKFTTLSQCLEKSADSKADKEIIGRFIDKLADEKEKSESVQFTNKDGSKNYVVFSTIEELPQIHLVSWYSRSAYTSVEAPILYRSIISCIIIVLIMSVFIFFAFSYNRRTTKMITRLAYEDETTGGKNLNYFKEYVLKILYDNTGVAFMMHRFDIANFRYINEAYGHMRADELLKIVIEEAEESFYDRELCVRMNADQFVMLTKNTADLEERFHMFTNKVNFRALDAGIRYPVKFKRGVYPIQNGEYDVSHIIDRANVARKTLSAEEKINVAVYADKLVNDMRKVNKIESEMEAALFNREFKVFVQSKWDIREDKLYGGEALVRWIKEDGNMVYPNDFVPIFEKNGFVEQLDFYMLEEVCKKIRMVLDSGGTAYPISVNQSRLLLHNPTYISKVSEILEKYQVPKKFIELEITETVLFLERDKMIAIMNELKDRQVLLSMDDFGSGYSSLNMLKDFPFDILKIDKEFFSESITSELATWILKKIIEMAEGLGIRVLCEGVETEKQVEILKKIGCRYVQGYYYSKPVPVDAFIAKNCNLPKAGLTEADGKNIEK